MAVQNAGEGRDRGERGRKEGKGITPPQRQGEQKKHCVLNVVSYGVDAGELLYDGERAGDEQRSTQVGIGEQLSDGRCRGGVRVDHFALELHLLHVR